MKRLIIVLCLFGILFIEVGSVKVNEYQSTKQLESIFVKDIASYNLVSVDSENSQKLSNLVYNFITENDEYTYEFSLNSSMPIAIYSLAKNIEFPMIEGEMFKDNEIPEALIGLDFEKLYNLEEKKINDEISLDDAHASVVGRIGTKTYSSDLNDIVVLDKDILLNNPNVFNKISTINISNPNNLTEFKDIQKEFEKLFILNNFELIEGSTIYGGGSTDLIKFIRQVLIQLSGILVILIIVLLVLINSIIVNENKLCSIYQLLGYRKSRILLIKAREKLKIFSKIMILSIILQYILSLIFYNIFTTPNIVILIYYIFTNIIIYLIYMILLCIKLYHYSIREGL